MSLSLLSLMRNDPDFGKRFTKKIEDVKQDKQGLLNAAEIYSEKYKNEILEGTKRRQLLISEGVSRGLSESESLAEHGTFIPTVYTPIMNLLYFMLRETELKDTIKYRQRDRINEALIKAGQLSHDENDPELSNEELNALITEQLKRIHDEQLVDQRRQEINKKFLKEEREENKTKNPPEVVNYLYGNITLEVFNKIKKLKALSRSPNESEAFNAYRKALELCNEYNLEFDRIPCYVESKDTHHLTF